MVEISTLDKIIETLSAECAVPKLVAWKHRECAKLLKGESHRKRDRVKKEHERWVSGS